MRCPVTAANKIMEKGKIQVGWVNARVTLLDPRPLQCFKCLEGGHVRDQCKSTVDRSSRCYRCGREGHKAQECNNAPKCPVCADLGRPANHRSGNKACTSAHAKKRRAAPAAKPKKVVTQVPAGTGGATSNREEPNNTVSEMVDEMEQPKPQRVRPRFLKPQEMELVKDKSAAEMILQQREETSQDVRDREKRASKPRKTNRKAVMSRDSDSEGERVDEESGH